MSAAEVVGQAFSDRQDLLQRIYSASANSTELATLFVDISNHINTLRISPSSNDSAAPSSKKRKLESQSNGTESSWEPGSFSTFNDISFSIPQRKKLKLDIASPTGQGIRAVKSDGEVDCTISWSDISEIACVPVPEKPTAQWNFCIFADKDNTSADQMLFTVSDTASKPGMADKANLISLCQKALLPYSRVVAEPDYDEFHSSVPQATHKGGTPYHIKAFRGAKDGYLFLLPTGILWGFKKPLEIFPFYVIESVSYTSVLQRTFNLNLAVKQTDQDETRELEFSMIDQADFAGIDAYIKRHELQDASMAEQRRAQKFNVNGVKTGQGEEGEDGEGEGELAKAAREAAEDDDDEEDDDNFDPGSEGESEGEGSDSDDEEAGDGEGEAHEESEGDDDDE